MSRISAVEVRELQVKLMPVIKKFQISSLYLFGSRARGDYDDDSDYDFLVDSKALRRIKDFNDMGDAMVAILGKMVDFVTPEMIEHNFFLKKGLREDGAKIHEEKAPEEE